MRVNRLFEITTLLLKRKTVPAREFAERFEVSVRTIYRDIEELSAAGVPVYMTKGKGGGISLLEDYTFDRTLISDQESDSLLMALKTLQATRYPDVEHFLEKLEALFQHSRVNDWVHIEYAPWGSAPNEDNKFIDIRHAILEQKIVSFDYIDARGERSRRVVEPMRVILKSQAWYLRGYCRMRNDFRTFRLSRMKNVNVSDEKFERLADSDREESGQQPAQPLTTLKLRFAGEVLQRVYDDFNDALVQKNPDGTCQVSIDLVVDEWVYGFILSYGYFIEVLEPDSVRQVIADRLKSALRLYVGGRTSFS